MTEVIGVRFKKVGKVYYFDPDGKKFEENQAVVVETSRGMEYGEVAMPNRGIADSMGDKAAKGCARRHGRIRAQHRAMHGSRPRHSASARRKLRNTSLI